MNSCAKCGFDNDQSDVFCGSCGTFLEWSRAGTEARVAVGSGGTPTAAPPGRRGADAGGRPRVDDPEVTVEDAPPVIEDDPVIVVEDDPIVPAEDGPAVTATAPARGEPGRDDVWARREAEVRAREQAKAEETARREEEAKRARAAANRRRAEALVVKPPPRPPRVKHRPRPGAAMAAEGAAAAGPTAGSPSLSVPAAVPPGAVRPAAPQARPKPEQKPPSRQLQAGDLICGECGEGNLPTRNFCRRCGSSLLEALAVPPPPVPWWKRPFVRKPKEFTAGARPMRRGGTTPDGKARKGGRAKRGLKIGGAAVGVVLVLGYLGPWRSTVNDKLSSGTNKVRRTVKPTFDPVHPVAAEATTQLPDHPAGAATDGISNTYWAEAAKGKGEGQALIVHFDPPVDIGKMGFLSGASAKPEEFLAQPRPKTLHLIFSDGTTADISLKDTAKFQSRDVKAKAVNRLEIQIAAVYSSVKGGQDASIAEIEFYTKR